MLIELKVKNFAIIDNLELEFGPGLNILSGETGAGKSVLLKSLSLLMGDKGEADIVRAGLESAVIEGYFDLSKRQDIILQLKEMGLEVEDETLVVRRVISLNGKGKVYLNGALSPLTSLRAVVAPLITLTGKNTPLVEMTGQHDNRHLQSKSYHLELLDQYSGTWKLRQEFETHYSNLTNTETKIARLTEASKSREQRLDFLRFQRDEIEALNLKPGDEQDIETKVFRLKNSKRLIEYLSWSVDALYANDDAVMVALHQIIQKGNELAPLDPNLSRKTESIVQAKALLEDAAYELREYARSFESNPEELSHLEERLSSLRKLQKKFGQSSDEILSAYQEIIAEIDSLEHHDESLKSLSSERSELIKSMQKISKDLHKRRSEGAVLLEKGVNAELSDLNMKGVIFCVSITWLDEMQSHGQSDIEFKIQTSAKDAPKSLAKVASGGELSRILLSLKRVVGHSDKPRTYLFDEVDTGVSGQTAEKVGRKLKAISQGQQLICVTHLPQVASFADSHFLIDKSPQKSGGVKMSVTSLNKDTRIKEIARLISGEKITNTSLQHARQLLTESH